MEGKSNSALHIPYTSPTKNLIVSFSLVFLFSVFDLLHSKKVIYSTRMQCITKNRSSFYLSHRIIILGKNVWSQGSPHVDRKTPWFCHLTASSATFFHTNKGLCSGNMFELYGSGLEFLLRRLVAQHQLQIKINVLLFLLVKAHGTSCHVFCMPLNGSLPTSSRVTTVGFEPTPLRKGGQEKKQTFRKLFPQAPSFCHIVVCAKHFLQIFHGRWNYLKSVWKFATKLQQEDD